ncbi:hypothetical protein RE6C_02901 [Rhodopirellula europaea 6C]|uniref:Uncharacterized protein n=1 Tax=Rhodopirellula europaea 6C TaxID=1263867 RepID=M2A6P0_9BACT|nr:hypothetical protein RE6C_02901 [Rhodopirellula europaea 6C]
MVNRTAQATPRWFIARALLATTNAQLPPAEPLATVRPSQAAYNTCQNESTPRAIDVVTIGLRYST